MSFFDFTTYNIPDKETLHLVNSDNELCVVVSEGSINEAQSTLLGKILKSVGKDLATAEMIEQKSDVALRFSGQKEQLILCFGIHPKQLNLQIEAKRYTELVLGLKTYIFSLDLASLPSSSEDRKALWISLKSYYGIT